MIIGSRRFENEDFQPDPDETVMVAAVRPQDMINEFKRDIMIGLIILEDLFPEMPFYPYLKQNGVLETRDEFEGLCKALSIIEACFGNYLRTTEPDDTLLTEVFEQVNERVRNIGVTVDMSIDNAKNLIKTVNNMDTEGGVDQLLKDLGMDTEGDDEVDP